MCGIAGIWSDGGWERLRAMADRLRHRGPDDEGEWISTADGIGLGHRRLSIIDLETGRQPIANEDGRIVTIFNGEIYNYRELRNELTGRGHRFKTQSDTEVIVHLYEDEGTEFPARLRGMFAIALWDDDRRQLVLVRDRVGKKPLYYFEGEGELLFASEIKGIVAAARTPLALDEQAVADYLTWAVVPAPETIYQRVRAVQPGELLVVRDRRIVKRDRYWRPTMLPKLRLSRACALEQIDHLLREAVRLRLRADVSVGCFLSGGLDSGLITALAALQHRQPLTTITVGFEEDSFDERPLARSVARQYGTDHHEILLRPDVADDLPDIVSAYDQPFGDASAIPSYYAARAARQHVKVVLNGDGGDELFAGYRRYLAARISRLLGWADGSQARPAWRWVHPRLPVPCSFRSPYAFLHRFVRGLTLDPVSRYLAWTVDGFDEESLKALSCGPHDSILAGGGAGSGGRVGNTRVDHTGRYAEEMLAALRACGPVDRMIGTDFATILPSDLLVKMDIATMAHGLEARSPFLDHELIDVVLRHEEALKLPGPKTKPLLRDLGRRYLPLPICKAPKRGFEVPLVRWLRGALKQLCEDVVLSRNGLLAERFNRAELERLLRQRSGLDPARWSRRVWLLLMLGMWDQSVHRVQPATEPAPTKTR